MLNNCENRINEGMVGAVLSRDASCETLAPKNRMAAMGLLLRILDQNSAAYEHCFVVCPDGTRVSYQDAVGVLSSMISALTCPDQELPALMQ